MSTSHLAAMRRRFFEHVNRPDLAAFLAKHDPDDDSITDDPVRWVWYATEVERGAPAWLAAMTAAQKFPGTQTEGFYVNHHGTLDKQFEHQPRVLQALIRRAKRAGYTPQVNDIYVPGLAQFPGDPRGFVPPANFRGDILRRAKEIGQPVSGDDFSSSPSYRPPEPDAPPETGFKPTKKEMRALRKVVVERDPQLRGKSHREVDEAVKATFCKKRRRR